MVLLSELQDDQIDRGKLLTLIVEHFNDDKLRTLCFDMHIRFEDLPSSGLSPKKRDLVGLCARHKRLAEDESYYALSTIMHSHKRHTVRQSNRILDREGQFWHHESFDHYVRNTAELERIRHYVITDPIRSGLVEHWEEWPWSYSKPFAADHEA